MYHNNTIHKLKYFFLHMKRKFLYMLKTTIITSGLRTFSGSGEFNYFYVLVVTSAKQLSINWLLCICCFWFWRQSFLEHYHPADLSMLALKWSLTGSFIIILSGSIMSQIEMGLTLTWYVSHERYTFTHTNPTVESQIFTPNIMSARHGFEFTALIYA